MKKYFILVLSAVLLSAVNVSAKDIDVLINGEKLQLDMPPVIENDRTLVPFRNIFETLGYEVQWIDEFKGIIAEKENVSMIMNIDNNEMYVNDEYVYSDTAPRLIDSTTYVPVRLISEYSGYDVLWSEKEQAVLLYSRQESYKPCIAGAYSNIATDGNYIYTNGDAGTFRFKEDLTRENLPFGSGNDMSIVDNKFYSRGIGGNLHYQCVDLETFEEQDLTNTDVSGCIISGSKIYYEFFPDPRNENPDKQGIYTMNLDGSDKKQIYPSHLFYDFIKDNIIFAENKIVFLNDGREQEITDKFITASALDDENYYIAINKYKDEATPLEPIGVMVYNYKTDEKKILPFDKEIRDIQVTDNSIFMTYLEDNTDYENFNICSLARLTKKLEYPVLLREKVYSDINVFGNYVYFYDSCAPENISGFSRISTDGKEYVCLEEYWNTELYGDKKISITYIYSFDNTEKRDAFISLLKTKLTYLGYTDAVVIADTDSCTVKISDIGESDPKEFADSLISGNSLTFNYPSGETIIDNKDIVKVSAKKGILNNAYEEYYIEIQITPEGRKKFAEATEYVATMPNRQNFIAVIFDNSVISAPVVAEKIDSDIIIISGNFFEESANELASLLNSSVSDINVSVAEIKTAE